MRNRDFYEGQLRALEALDSSPEHIRQVAAQIKILEDREKQAKADKEKGTKGLNNAEKHRLKELRTERTMLERKEELEVLLNMNGIEEFTQEAEREQAQAEALAMVDQMIDSNAERAANEAKGATTLEEGKTLTGRTAQREGLKGYYETTVPTQMTKRGEIKAEKAQMSKNSLLGASMQLATLNKLLTRPDLSEAQVSMINKLIKYFNRVLDTLDTIDRQFEESTRAVEETERETEENAPAETQTEVGDASEQPKVVAEEETEIEDETVSPGTPEEVKPEETAEITEDTPEEIDYDNLTEEQKRQFQIQGARANLDNIVKQLRELDAQKDEAKKQLEEAERNGDEAGRRDAQFAISRINMKMTPLRNKAQELVAEINKLEAREETETAAPTQETEEQEKVNAEEEIGDTTAAEPGAPSKATTEKETRAGEKDEETAEQSEPEVQGPPQQIEHVSGLKAVLEAFIRVLQAITRNPNLLEGTRQKLVTIEYLPPSSTTNASKIDPSKASKEITTEVGKVQEEVQEELDEREEETPQEGETSKAKAEDEESKPWDLAPEQKRKINADSAEIAKGLEKSAEGEKAPPSSDREM